MRRLIKVGCHGGVARWLQTIALGLVFGAFSDSVQGLQTVELIWNPSPDSGVAGYKLHYGTASKQYSNVVDVGRQTTRTVSGLQDGVPYFFAVTAYAANGAESTFSNEILFSNTPPASSAIGDCYLPKSAPSCTIPFTVWDAETPAAELLVTVTSSNPALIPGSNLVLGGSGSSRTITLITNTPHASNSGTATITVSVNDGFSTANRSFQLALCKTSQMPQSPLTVQISGIGTVTPNLSGSNLAVGLTYELVAVPGPAKVFSGWSGGVTSGVARLTFIMRSNLVLGASFAPHAFAGTYNGLFHETNEVRPESAGFFWAHVDTNGLYSARLDIAGTNYAWSGQFGGKGRASCTLPLAGTNTLAVRLFLDRSNATDQITGQVSTGNWVAGLLADRAISDAVVDCLAYKGRYTLAIPGFTDPTAGPPGSGFATINVSKKGKVTITGETADGRPLVQSAALSRRGEWPLYVSLSGGKGLLLGWLTFANLGTHDLAGMLSWIKPGSPSNKLYPGGFTNESVAVGCRYDTTQYWGLTNTVLVAGAGNLSAELSSPVSWVISNRVVTTSVGGLPIGLDPATGIFRGAFVNPDTGTTTPFAGAVLHRLNQGAGYFRGTNLCGWAVLEPAP